MSSPADSIFGQKFPIWGLFAALLVMGFVFVYHEGMAIWSSHQQYDDSYITYRYAMNLATGRGLVFNPGDMADSATSFLYTVLLALAYMLGIHNLEHIGLLVGLAAVGIMVWRIQVMLAVATGEPVAAAITSVAIGIGGLFSGWALQGMETPFYAMLMLLAVERAFVVRKDDRWTCFLLVLNVLTRPEGLVLVGVYGLSRVNWLEWRSLLTLPGWKILLWRERYGLTALAVAGLFYVGKYLYYEGTWVSMAGQLKHVVPYYAARPDQLLKQWQNHLGVAWVLGLLGMVMKRRVYGPWYMLLVGLMALVCLFGMHSDFVRYGTALTPLVVLPAGHIAILAMKRFPLGLGLLVVLALTWQSATGAEWIKKNLRHNVWGTACRMEVGQWLKAHTKVGELVLGSDIGAIGYGAWPVPIMDMFGLTSRPIFDRVMAGRNKDDLLIAAGQGLIADTFHGSDKLNIYQRLYSYYTQGGVYTIPAPATSLNWHIDNVPLKLCKPGEVSNYEIAVRRVRWEQ